MGRVRINHRGFIAALITAILFFGTLVLITERSAFGQTATFFNNTYTIAKNDVAINNQGSPITLHRLTWVPIGTVSTCTVALDSSVDGSTWVAGGVIAGQTCTGASQSAVTIAEANYVRVSLTALSGGGSIGVTYDGNVSATGLGSSVRSSMQYNSTYTAPTVDSGVNLNGSPITIHRLTWVPIGTVSTCNVALDSSVDGTNWSAGGAIVGQTCTSAGQSVATTKVTNFVRINLGTFTGTGSVVVIYDGNIASANGAGSPVFTNQTNVYGAFLQDFSAGSIDLPDGAGFVATTDSNIGIDTTGQNVHLFNAGTDTLIQSSQAILALNVIPKSANGSSGLQTASLCVENGTTLACTDSGGASFVGITSTGAVSLSPANLAVTISPTGTGTVAINPTAVGAIDNVNIGATTPGTIKGTNVNATLTYKVNSKLLGSATAPTISSGFGTSPTIPSNNGTFVFTINVGTGGAATTGVVALPAATTGWHLSCDDITTKSATVDSTVQTGVGTTTTVPIGNFTSGGIAGAWVASDILLCTAMAY
jgi:hypothetical protein